MIGIGLILLLGISVYSEEFKLFKKIDCRKHIKILDGIFSLQPQQRFIKFTPDSKHFATANYKVVSLWETKTGKLVWQTRRKIADQRSLGFTVWMCFGLDISPDNKYIVACGCGLAEEDGNLQVADIRDGDIIDFLDYGTVQYVRFSPDGKYIAASKYNRVEVFSWSGEELELCKTFFYVPHISWDYNPGSIAFSPDGELIASILKGKKKFRRYNQAKIWNFSTDELLKTFTYEDPPSDIEFSSDGEILAVSCADRIYFYSTKNYKFEKTKEYKAKSRITSISFSPNSKSIALGRKDGKIEIFEVEPGKTISVLDAHEKEVCCVDFSSDGKYLASSGSDYKLTLWLIE